MDLWEFMDSTKHLGGGSMRVSAGVMKGHRLRSSRGMALRPTAMKVKEALFDVLRDRVKGASLVDFFAGTGNVGIEALSRGADHVVFVENHSPSVKLLKNNLTTCGLHHKATVYNLDAFTFLKKIKKRPAAGGLSSGSASDGPKVRHPAPPVTDRGMGALGAERAGPHLGSPGGIGGRFSLFPHGPPHAIDILFADPPYHGPLAERFLRQLGKSDIMSERALVVIEHFHKLALPDRTGCLGLVKRYRYGDTLLSVYKYSVEEPCLNRQGFFDPSREKHDLIRSLTPPSPHQAEAGTAGAARVQSQSGEELDGAERR